MSRLNPGGNHTDFDFDLKNQPGLCGRVLVAEAPSNIQKVTARNLGRLGLQVTTAASGREAVNIALLAKQVQYPFDAILVETEPSGANGADVIRALRERGLVEPIVAVVNGGSGQPCRDAGCNACIVKPVTFEQIYTTLRRFLEPVRKYCSQIE